MTFDAFRSLVEANSSWFVGVYPESASTFDAAERALGIRLPASLRWLLGSWGYSSACGVDSLDETVAATLRCRFALSLPDRYVVLNDWGDVGAVVLDATIDIDPDLWPIYWMGAHNLRSVTEGELPRRDCDRFNGFGEWVQSRLALAVEDIG